MRQVTSKEKLQAVIDGVKNQGLELAKTQDSTRSGWLKLDPFFRVVWSTCLDGCGFCPNATKSVFKQTLFVVFFRGFQSCSIIAQLFASWFHVRSVVPGSDVLVLATLVAGR